MTHHLLPPHIVVLCVVFLGLPEGVRLEENDGAIRDADGSPGGEIERVKRQVDNSDLVVEKDFIMTRNKEIKGLSEKEKRTMLHMHNAYRSLVRPLGANMIELTWDDSIANFAQEWANNCTATHRPNRDLHPWVGMGENLYWWYSGKYNVKMPVKWWWDEVQYYNMATKECKSGEMCGHYETLVWAKSEKIGCGVARCDLLKDLPQYQRGSYYFVCNYSGRFLTKGRPYIATDTPCSACYKTGYPKCRYNLCVTQDMIDNDNGYNGSTIVTGLNRTTTFTQPKTKIQTPKTTTKKQTTPALTTKVSKQRKTNGPDPTVTIELTERDNSTRNDTEKAVNNPGGAEMRAYYSLPLMTLLSLCFAATAVLI